MSGPMPTGVSNADVVSRAGSGGTNLVPVQYAKNARGKRGATYHGSTAKFIKTVQAHNGRAK
jgi:hypothetical protein